MFRQPSMLRNSIYPLATGLKSRIKAASSVSSSLSRFSLIPPRGFMMSQSSDRVTSVRPRWLAPRAPAVPGRLADRQRPLANIRRLLENRRPATST